MGKIIVEKDSQIEKTSSGILEVIRNHRKKLSIGLGAITIVSGMLLSSGCSSNNENDDFKTETTTTLEDINGIEEFDPSKCEIEGNHKHLCTWEKMREYSGKGEMLTKFHYWCKDSEIEKLRAEHPNSNFKVEGHEFIIEPKELEEFDPDKCEIEDKHFHMCTANITEVTVDEEGNKVEKITKLDRWCTDEIIKLEQENDPNFKVYDECKIYPNYKEEEGIKEKVLK